MVIGGGELVVISQWSVGKVSGHWGERHWPVGGDRKSDRCFGVRALQCRFHKEDFNPVGGALQSVSDETVAQSLGARAPPPAKTAVPCWVAACRSTFGGASALHRRSRGGRGRPRSQLRRTRHALNSPTRSLTNYHSKTCLAGGFVFQWGSHWSVVNGQWSMVSGKRRVIGQWSVVSGKRRVIGHWSVVSGQWSVGREESLVIGQWSVGRERRVDSPPHRDSLGFSFYQ